MREYNNPRKHHACGLISNLKYMHVAVAIPIKKVPQVWTTQVGLSFMTCRKKY